MSHVEQELLILQGHLSSCSIFNVEGEYGIFPMLCKQYSVEENILICINDSNTTGVTCGAGTVDCSSIFKAEGYTLSYINIAVTHLMSHVQQKQLSLLGHPSSLWFY